MAKEQNQKRENLFSDIEYGNLSSNARIWANTRKHNTKCKQNYILTE